MKTFTQMEMALVGVVVRILYPTWKKKNGKCIDPSKMSTGHIIHALAMGYFSDTQEYQDRTVCLVLELAKRVRRVLEPVRGQKPRHGYFDDCPRCTK